MTWTYGAAPESAALANLQPAYRPFVDGEFVDGSGPMKTRQPGHRGGARRGRHGVVRRRRPGGRRRPPGATSRRGARCPAPSGPSTCSASRGSSPSGPASWPCWRRWTPASRSASPATSTCPTAAAHLFHHAGWADKLEYAGLGPRPRPLGVVGAVIPWNFPLLMAAWKIAPALAMRQHDRAQARRDHAADRAGARRDRRRGRAARRACSTCCPARATSAPRWWRTPASTRWRSPAPPTSGSRSARARGHRQRLTLELGGKAANIVHDDAALDQAVDGIVEAIGFDQGHVCCAGCGCRAGVGRRRARWSCCGRGSPRCASATRWTRTPTSARSTPARSCDQIVDLAAAGDAEGARRWTSPCPLPERGLFFPPTVFSDVAPTMRVAREEISGPVLPVLTFRTPGRGRREGEQHPLRPVRRRVDGQGQPGAVDGAAAAGRRGVDEHVQPVRPDEPVRRHGRVGLRPGRRPRGPGRLPRRADRHEPHRTPVATVMRCDSTRSHAAPSAGSAQARGAPPASGTARAANPRR